MIVDIVLEELRKLVAGQLKPVDDGWYSIGTESVAAALFDQEHYIDAYGSGIYKLKWEVADIHEKAFPDTVGRRFIIWETYGDEDSDRHDECERGKLLYTLAVWTLDKNGGAVERQDVADIYVMWDGTIDVIRLFEGGPLPKEVVMAAKGRIGKGKKKGDGYGADLGGKRAFYLHTEPAEISVSCSERFYRAYPQWRDPSRPIGNPNLSGTRALFPLKRVL